MNVTYANADKSDAHLSNLLDKLDNYRSELKANPLPLFSVPHQRDDFASINELATTLKKFRRVVFLGTGGSSFGGQVLAQLNGWGIAPHQQQRGQQRGQQQRGQQQRGQQKGQENKSALPALPALFFLDNLSAHSLAALLSPNTLPDTGFVVISKSGGTADTLMQFSAALSAVQKAGLPADKHFFAITENTKNPLRRIAESLKIKILPHNPDIGGRFSVLTNVGLLPAALAGLDITAVRKGAARSLTDFLTTDTLRDNSPAMGAALQIAHSKKGRVISVLMPYDERLDRFAFWYRQLWAESLGKDKRGTTPVNALGPVDQHSQLQLYLEGADDKFYTLITAPQNNTLTADAQACNVPELNWLHNRKLGDLVAAHAEATYQALMNKGRPVRKIDMRAFDEEAIGHLLMDFMLETILAAHLLEVNAFDQPAVEQGKIIAKNIM